MQGTTMFDTSKATYGEFMTKVGVKRQRLSEVREYGKHFLALGSVHGFVVYNGFSKWPRSDALNC